MNKTLKEQITQLRICLAHHSYIYYELGHQVIRDNQWDLWARELKVLQARYGDLWNPKYDKWFKDWDGSTGYLLCSIPGLKSQVRKTNPELLEEEIEDGKDQL